MSDRSDIGAIARVLRLVSLLADQPNVSAKDAAEILGWPLSTTHRLLRRLIEAEYASQTRKGAFAPGPELFRLAGRLGGQQPAVRIVQPLLDSLADRFRETALVTILQRRNLQMYVAASAAPPDPMRYFIELNRTAALVWGALGRAMLAQLSAEEIERAILGPNVPDARGNPLDPDELRKHLAEIRENKFAITYSHRTMTSVGVAVPFLDHSGEPTGSIGFQIPEFRYSEEQASDMVAALKEAAAVISQQIGARVDL
ncbi:IclR family transcriptional regulator [Devosia sp. YIM 151766]|uniref:IclR family transcriptional regulator n=1 Tax=Devosia sp. YIM 151766 TaxID=3017325 RepID=UPI00255C4EF3|nr:IclR family transcriptional regulator [Devosia sp. YIM 151766]WIY52728.1 IclR family transcriptional regulator [Devosia sp. YIM 151766]